MFVIFEKS